MGENKFRLIATINGERCIWYFNDYRAMELHMEYIIRTFGLTSNDVDFEQAPFSHVGG